ncbi:MAG: GNAT family N-acetyltransferase [Chloroflexi bacterium RBG_19FT_COMBO_56_12]|nr:MAG: GNAT family N-acetyltransferase [Chloroflexi bacterium RBG_19FT_COMBO_56_12]
MIIDILQRDVAEGDLPIFFEQQLDLTANYMVAFTSKDPADREAFTTHWAKILSDKTIMIKTIIFEGHVAGYILSHGWYGKPEVSYWIGKEYWGKGIATQALSEFLGLQETRPLYAWVAKDNVASLRVLEKCGFTIVGYGEGFSNARGEQVEEVNLKLAKK